MIRSKKDQLEGRIKKFVANIYTKNHWDMSEKLKRFTALLDNEDDKKGDGLTEVKKILEKVDEIYNIKSFESLEGFLFSTELNPPIGDQVHQDMNAPLSHYFIHTSLNSYFTGNRVYPKYSIEPIIDALRQGVRVVELDLWPCGKDGICVRPSWNIEKPLQLQDCLDSIKEYAFTLTDYPVIITFKDSLKTDLQSKAIQMINQTFENMVYHHSSEEFPSPEQLRNKILISRRPPKELLYANDAEETLDVRNGVELRHESEDPNYQSLVAFNAVEPGGMLRKALTDKAENIQRPGWYETDVIRFTQNKFLRTRPKRKLLIYAPYKPQRAWMHGAQMIALSRQDDREKLWLMQGMFRANGGCGYVKKPDFLLDASPSRLSGVFYPTVDPSVEKTLKVKVYMGDGWLVDFKKHIGRLSNPDLYVMISIAGVAHDENTMKTAVKYNEWTPTWGQEFTFRLTYPDLALLRIEVYNHEVSSADGFCGQTCLPVSELIEGIRAVPLYDEKGEACSSTMLLIRFKWS